MKRLLYIALSLAVFAARSALATTAFREPSPCELWFDPGPVTLDEANAVGEILRWVALVHPAFDAVVRHARHEADFANLLTLTSAFTLAMPTAPPSVMRNLMQRAREIPPDVITPEDEELNRVRGGGDLTGELGRAFAERLVRNLGRLSVSVREMGFSYDQRPTLIERHHGTAKVTLVLPIPVQVYGLSQIHDVLAPLPNPKLNRLAQEFLTLHFRRIVDLYDFYSLPHRWRQPRDDWEYARTSFTRISELIYEYTTALRTAREALVRAPDFIPAGMGTPPPPSATKPAVAAQVTTLEQVGGSHRELLRHAFGALDEITRWQRRVLEAKSPAIDWAAAYAARDDEDALARALGPGVHHARGTHFEHLALVEEAEAAIARTRAWAGEWLAQLRAAAGDNVARDAMTATEARSRDAANLFFEQLVRIIDQTIAALAARGAFEHESIATLGGVAFHQTKYANARLDGTATGLSPEFIEALRRAAGEPAP